MIGYPTQVHPYGKDSQLYVWEYSGTGSVPHAHDASGAGVQHVHARQLHLLGDIDELDHDGYSLRLPDCRGSKRGRAGCRWHGGRQQLKSVSQLGDGGTGAASSARAVPSDVKRPEGPFSCERIDQDHATYAPTSERDHAACATKHVHRKKAESTSVEHGPHCPL